MWKREFVMAPRDARTNQKYVETCMPMLTTHVLASRQWAAELVTDDCNPNYWKDKNTLEYMVSTVSAVKHVLGHVYCWSGAPQPPEIAIVRGFIDARKREALDMPVGDCTPWHLYCVEEYFFSLAAMELVLDGVLNPEPLVKLWSALELHYKKVERPFDWNARFDGKHPSKNTIYGLIGKTLLGEGDAVIAFMKSCSPKDLEQIDVEDFEGQPYKVIYHTAIRQMQVGDPEAAYYGQRAHATFFTWAWLNAWKDNTLPGTFSLTGLFMLWAAIRLTEGLPLEPQAILQSFQPEPVCRLFLECLGQEHTDNPRITGN